MKEVRLGQNSDHLHNQSGRAVHHAEAVNSHVNRNTMCRKWKYWVVSGKLFLPTITAHALCGHLLPHFEISDTPPFKLRLSTPLHSPALLCQTADPNPMHRQGQAPSHKRPLFCCCLSLASYSREDLPPAREKGSFLSSIYHCQALCFLPLSCCWGRC